MGMQGMQPHGDATAWGCRGCNRMGMQGMQPHPQFVSCVMPRQLFGQKFGCYLGKIWGKTENLVTSWAKFDIKKMNE